jgi:hypothetical protein
MLPAAHFTQIWPPVWLPQSALFGVGATGFEQALTTSAAALRIRRAILLRRMVLPRESGLAASFLPSS